MATESTDRTIARLAARQYGAVSRTQALAAGATAAFIRTRTSLGRWERVRSGIYRVGGAPPSWRQEVLVQWLACGPAAALSHRAAAALWRLPRFTEGQIEFSLPPEGRRPSGIVLHRAELASADIATVDRIRVTSPARTLIDVAAIVPVEQLAEALDEVVRRRLASLPTIERRAEELSSRGRAGIGDLRALLAQRRDGRPVPQSVLETRLLRLIHDHSLPPPVRQFEVWVEGRLLAALDFAYPDARLALEADGYRWHGSKAQWQRDLARRNRLVANGWRVCHVTWEDVTRRPARTAAEIRWLLREGA